MSFPSFLSNSHPKETSDRPQNGLKDRLLIVALLTGCGTIFYILLARLSMAPPLQALPAVLCVPSCTSSELSSHPGTSSSSLSSGPLSSGPLTANPQANSQTISELLAENFDKTKVSVLVEKSAYKLTVFYDSKPVKTYPVVLGSAPVGDKFAEGDRKTPEGIYRIRDLYPHPEWSKFIWLDYPTPQDWREHTQAKLSGEIPLTATIGSEVGIHGVPAGADNLIDTRTDWTWGCVSLKNSDVDEIYDVVTQGTVIEIVP
ncbi:MAG: murein L,D-transpeptidase family protein [Phormidesmis sp.]